jgi:predicted CopG family antitoxin
MHILDPEQTAMATKSITIDLEAYERLCAARHGKESFSQVIKRRIPKPFDLAAFREELDAISLSDEAVEAIEEQVSRRHEPSTRER